MAERSGGNGDSSQPLITEETAAANTTRFTTSSQTLNPHIPSNLIWKILLMLPVKSLLRFRCVCKSWNALISDPKFAKEHLRDPTHSALNRLVVTLTNRSGERLLRDFSITSVFSNSIASSSHEETSNFYICSESCHGMLLLRFPNHISPSILWNPATRKFKDYPFLGKHWNERKDMTFGFGYDHISDSYKVVAVINSTYVRVHVLGTDSWREIQGFPGRIDVFGVCKFVCGAFNWLALDNDTSNVFIFSLDLATDTHQQLLLPDDISDTFESLAVLKGCLCILSRCSMNSSVWIMKDYGDRESWTKLLSFPCDTEFLTYHHGYTMIQLLCISDDDDQILLESGHKLVVYNSKSGTFRTTEVESFRDHIVAKVYAESLISP